MWPVWHGPRSRVELFAVLLSGSDLRQVIHTCSSVTKQYKLVPVKDSDTLWLGGGNAGPGRVLAAAPGVHICMYLTNHL